MKEDPAQERSGLAAYRAQRLAHLQALRQEGYRPFGCRFERTGRLSEVRSRFRPGHRERIAGRIVALRPMGKSTFAHLQEGGDRFQIYLRSDDLGEASYGAFRRIDLGDFIGAEGTLFTTRTGEPTLHVERWTLLCKALLPLPEKWHGLRDVDARYRQRYLDLLANPEVRGRFDRRAAIVRAIREYLHERGFAEVETPMMQPLAGGAVAKPFRTHWDALNATMYLRIAPELYLKRLLVGGYDAVFELNRNFRNEGLSRTHNPEFTMLEAYQAYSDADGMRDLVQDMIKRVAEQVFGTLRVGSPEAPIDLTPPWREVLYRDLIRERLGADWYELPLEEARRRVQAAGFSVDPAWDHVQLAHEVYEKGIEKQIVQPTFVRRLPRELVPLARTCEDDPTAADVYELVIAGQEISPGYSELNDPLEQRRRFEAQAQGRPEAVDEDFLTALEHGMPPAGGMGLGVDRLVMVLTGAESIRDVILFPQLRPREH